MLLEKITKSRSKLVSIYKSTNQRNGRSKGASSFLEREGSGTETNTKRIRNEQEEETANLKRSSKVERIKEAFSNWRAQLCSVLDDLCTAVAKKGNAVLDLDENPACLYDKQLLEIVTLARDKVEYIEDAVRLFFFIRVSGTLTFIAKKIYLDVRQVFLCRRLKRTDWDR